MSSFEDQVIELCNRKGWNLRYHNHPKTRAGWGREPQRQNQTNNQPDWIRELEGQNKTT